MLILLIFLKVAFLKFESSLPIKNLITYFVSFLNILISRMPETPGPIDRAKSVIK